MSWADGPTPRRVEAITGAFEGSSFDGMQDMEVSLRTTLADGRRTGLRGVSTSRRISAALARRAAAQVAAFYGVLLPTITETDSGRFHVVDDDAVQRQLGENWGTMIYQAASDRTRFARGV